MEHALVNNNNKEENKIKVKTNHTTEWYQRKQEMPFSCTSKLISHTQNKLMCMSDSYTEQETHRHSSSFYKLFEVQDGAHI